MVKVTIKFGRVPTDQQLRDVIDGDGPIPQNWPDRSIRLATEGREKRLAEQAAS